jgi:hypothetical protein
MRRRIKLPILCFPEHRIPIRVGWIASCLLFLAIALGCMSLGIGERNVVVSQNDSPGHQSGKITVNPSQEMNVYYPIPYQYPPNLQTENPGTCVVVEQKTDHFRIKNTGIWAQDVTWQSRGVQISTTTTITTTDTATAVPPSPPPVRATLAAPPKS